MTGMRLGDLAVLLRSRPVTAAAACLVVTRGTVQGTHVPLQTNAPGAHRSRVVKPYRLAAALAVVQETALAVGGKVAGTVMRSGTDIHGIEAVGADANR